MQEALTNAAKHAGHCRVVVALRWQPQTLELEITNDQAEGSRADGVTSGRGLIGMRERVALVGGDLEVGHRANGQFAVHARLPLQDAP